MQGHGSALQCWEGQQTLSASYLQHSWSQSPEGFWFSQQQHNTDWGSAVLAVKECLQVWTRSHGKTAGHPESPRVILWLHLCFGSSGSQVRTCWKQCLSMLQQGALDMALIIVFSAGSITNSINFNSKYLMFESFFLILGERFRQKKKKGGMRLHFRFNFLSLTLLQTQSWVLLHRQPVAAALLWSQQRVVG